MPLFPQDPVRVVKTLAYQLAHSLPALQPYYCGLDPGTLMQLHQPDAACRELLMVPLQKHARGQQVCVRGRRLAAGWSRVQGAAGRAAAEARARWGGG